MRKGGISFSWCVVFQGNGECFLCTDKDNEVFTSRDRGVKKVSLKEGKMLVHDRYDDSRVFRPLRLVHGNGVRQR